MVAHLALTSSRVTSLSKFSAGHLQQRKLRVRERFRSASGDISPGFVQINESFQSAGHFVSGIDQVGEEFEFHVRGLLIVSHQQHSFSLGQIDGEEIRFPHISLPITHSPSSSSNFIKSCA